MAAINDSVCPHIHVSDEGPCNWPVEIIEWDTILNLQHYLYGR